MSQASKESSRRRIIWLGLILISWMIIIFWRLAWIQVVDHEYYARLALSDQRKKESLLPLRGTIYDREGKILAMSVIMESLLIDQVLFNVVQLSDKEKKSPGASEQKIAKKQACAVSNLSGLLGIGQSDFAQMLVGTNQHLWIRRNLPPEIAEAIREQLNRHDLKGISLVEEEQREYPYQQLAAHLIGYVGVNEESDERIGRSGIEQMMNLSLTGRKGDYVQIVNAAGVPYQRQDSEPRHGNSIYLTIDHALQRKVEYLLLQTVEQHRAKGGGVVIMEPATGDILALANYPTYDPNRIDANVATAKSYVNQAVVSPYEPGSIFKMVTYAAAIDQGVIRPEEMIDCGNGQISIGPRMIRDTHSFGKMTIADSFANSSNVGAIRIAQRLGKETFHRYIRDFGFGALTGTGLPAESPGIVHAPAKWRPDSIGSVAIGQEISVTLVQAVTAVAAIANNGRLVQPRLVSKVVDAKGVPFHQPDRPQPREVIKPETAKQMVKLMERVVTHGTGRLAVRLEGYTAAGKTGTPQKPGRSGYEPGSYVPSFLGFVPTDKPRFAIVVMIDEPSNGSYYGAVVAAPLFAMVAEAALRGDGVLPDEQNYRERLEQIVRRASEGGEGADVPDLSDGDEVGDGRPSTIQRSALIPGLIPFRGGGPADLPAAPVRGAVATGEAPSPVGARRAVPTENGSGPAMPDLRGQGMKIVISTCGDLGLKLRLSGNGVVVRQYPAAGARIRPGDECRMDLQ